MATDPEVQRLLTELHDIGGSSYEPGIKVSRTLAKFAELQVLLAEQAEKTSREVVDLTEQLVSLTKALKAFTVVLVVVGIIPILFQIRDEFFTRPNHSIATPDYVQPSQNQPQQQKPTKQ